MSYVSYRLVRLISGFLLSFFIRCRKCNKSHIG